MSLDLENFGLANLSAEEKLELADALQESAARDLENAPLTEAKKAELDRRLALWDADPNRGIPMEVVFEEIRKKHGW